MSSALSVTEIWETKLPKSSQGNRKQWRNRSNDSGTYKYDMNVMNFDHKNHSDLAIITKGDFNVKESMVYGYIQL